MSFYISFECWNKFQALTQALRSWIRQNCLGINIVDNLVIWLTTNKNYFSEMISNLEEVKGDVIQVKEYVKDVKGDVKEVKGDVKQVKDKLEDLAKKEHCNQPGKFS